jgi:hypothetical protein
LLAAPHLTHQATGAFTHPPRPRPPPPAPCPRTGMDGHPSAPPAVPLRYAAVRGASRSGRRSSVVRQCVNPIVWDTVYPTRHVAPPVFGRDLPCCPRDSANASAMADGQRRPKPRCADGARAPSDRSHVCRAAMPGADRTTWTDTDHVAACVALGFLRRPPPPPPPALCDRMRVCARATHDRTAVHAWLTTARPCTRARHACLRALTCAVSAA